MIFVDNCRCEIIVAFKRNMGIIRFSYTRLVVKCSLLVETSNVSQQMPASNVIPCRAIIDSLSSDWACSKAIAIMKNEISSKHIDQFFIHRVTAV